MQAGPLRVISCERTYPGSREWHYVVHVEADDGLVSLVYRGPLLRRQVTQRIKGLLRREKKTLKAGVYWLDDRFTLGRNILACFADDAPADAKGPRHHAVAH